MTASNTTRIFTLVLLSVSFLYQSAAYPLHFDKFLNIHTILKARSFGTEQPQRRAMSPVVGDIATTIIGNAIGGAIGPIFEDIGTSLSSGTLGHSSGSGDHAHDEGNDYQTFKEPYHKKGPDAISQSNLEQNSEESPQRPAYGDSPNL